MVTELKTPEELEALRQPVDVFIPKEGLFRGVGNIGGLFFKEPTGKIRSLDIGEILSNDERAALGNKGQQMGKAQELLLQKYGIDFTKLPEFNIGDLISQSGMESRDLFLGTAQGTTIEHFVNRQAAQGQQFRLNETPIDTRVAPPQPDPTPRAAGQAGDIQLDTVDDTGRPTQATFRVQNNQWVQVLPDGSVQPVTDPQVFSQLAQETVKRATESSKNLQRLQDLGFNEDLPQGVDIRDISTALEGGAGQSAALQKLAQQNPEFADKIMDKLGFETIPEADLPQARAAGESILDSFRAQGANINADIFNANPLTALKDLVGQVMESLGLPDITGQIESINKEIEKFDAEFADKVESINDNPWISEAQRSREVTKAQEKYELKKSAAVDRLTLLQDSYREARQQAQFAATTAINLYDQERRFAQDQLEFYLDQAERESRARREDIKLGIDVAREERLAGQAADKFDSNRYRNVQGGVFDLQTQQFVVAPKPPKDDAPGGSLTISEADTLGLPRALAGLNQQQVFQDLNTKTAPSWFVQMLQEQKQMSLVPTSPIVQQEWDKFRNNVLFAPAEKKKKTSTGEGGGIDYGAMSLPSPVK